MIKIKPSVKPDLNQGVKPGHIISDLLNPEAIEEPGNIENYSKIQDDEPGHIDIYDDDDDEMEQEESGPDDLSDSHIYSKPEVKLLAGSIIYDGKKISHYIYPHRFKYEQNLKNIEFFFEAFIEQFGKFIKAPAGKCFLYFEPIMQKTLADAMFENISKERKENSKKDDLKEMSENSVTSWLSNLASKYQIKINDICFDICDLFDQKEETLSVSEFAIAVLISGNDVWPLIELIDTDVKRAEEIEKILDYTLMKERKLKLFKENKNPKKNIKQAGKIKTLKNAYEFAYKNRGSILYKYFY